MKRDAYGHWHAAIVYGVETIAHSEECFDHPKVAEGFDAGLCDILTDTEGGKVEAPEWERARSKLARIHLNIARERRGFMHRLSRDFVDSCSFIA